MPLSTAAAHRKDLSGNPAAMTHQHFRAIAAVLRGIQDVQGVDPATHDRIIARFANALGYTNPRFDRDRFVAAATPGEG